MKENSDPLHINYDNLRIIIKERYDALNALNDILIAMWFLIGSFFFLDSDLTVDGTWLFILGSMQMLIRPIIELSRLIHIRRIDRKKIG